MLLKRRGTYSIVVCVSCICNFTFSSNIYCLKKMHFSPGYSRLPPRSVNTGRMQGIAKRKNWRTHFSLPEKLQEGANIKMPRTRERWHFFLPLFFWAKKLKPQKTPPASEIVLANKPSWKKKKAALISYYAVFHALGLVCYLPRCICAGFLLTRLSRWNLIGPLFF